MKQDDNYCGFACGDIIARQQQILDEITDFSKHNREYALVMIGKIMEMVYYGKDKLINKTEPPELTDEIRTELEKLETARLKNSKTEKDPCYEMESESGPK